MDLVVVGIRAFPLDVRRLSGKLLQCSQTAGIAVNQVRIFGDVVDDLDSGFEQLIAPSRQDRADEMHEMHPLTENLPAGLRNAFTSAVVVSMAPAFRRI